MNLEIDKSATVGASLESTWTFVRDFEQLISCIPGVTEFASDKDDRTFSAVLSDKVGPFRLQLPVQIRIEEIVDLSRISADVAGQDRRGMVRVKGTLVAELGAKDSATELSVRMNMNVLGRLASLGAGPMRRRADAIFDEFVECVVEQLGVSPESEGVEETSRD